MDFFLFFVKFFTTWLRLRILMGCLIVILIVLMSLSAWTTQSSGGNFSKITFPNNHTYSNWYNDVCEEYPYAYLTPFTFTYSSSTESSSKETYCPWPLANSILRLAGTCMAMVTLGLLYIKTPLSIFARVIHAFYALLFFAIFVIDAAVQSAGLGFCNKAFANTVLNQDMSSLNMTITCSSDGETAIVVFDVVASVIFFILHSAWGLTADIYLEKKDDSKYLLKKKAKSKK
eukprot:gene1423-1548_t